MSETLSYNNIDFVKLEDEKGDFLWSNYGSAHAIGFRGNSRFIERCNNFVVNFGLSKTRKKLSSLGLGMIYYVCTNEQRFLRGLTDYYTGQIITRFDEYAPKLSSPDNHRQLVTDEDGVESYKWNDNLVDSSAAELAKSFFTNRLIHTNFMSLIENVGLDTHSLIR